MSSKPIQEKSVGIQSDTCHQNRTLVETETSNCDYEDCIRLVFDNANVGICLVDLNGRLLSVNRHMCDMFGYSKGEFEGMSVNDITHPDFLEVSPNYMKQALNGVVTDGEFQKKYIHKKGHIIWGQVSSSLVLDHDGKPRYFISYVKEINDIKQKEHELRKERDFTSAVLSTAGALVVVLDRQGRIIRFNRACEKLTGYFFQEVKGKCFWDLFLLPNEIDQVKDVFENLKSGLFPNEHENYWLTKSGSRRLIKWSNTALSESDESVEYIIGTGIDITDTRAAEEKLQDSEERFALATRGSGHGLWDWADTSRSEVWWSPRLYEMLGYQNGEIESSLNSFNLLLHPDDRDKVQDAIDTHLKNGDMYDIEIRMETKSGAYRWFRTCGAAIKNAKGRPVRMSGSLIDIDDRKQAEKALLESEKKYRMLLANLDTAVVVHAPDTRILLSNLRAQGLLGLSEKDMANRKDSDSYWSFLRADGTRLPVEEYPVNIVSKTLKPLQYYLVGINHPRRNNTIWVEVNAFPEFGDNGDLRQIVVTFWDVTKRKLAEDNLAKKTIDLANINKELRRQITEREQVEEKLRYKQRQADKELEVAATIQQALIPRYSPRIGPIRLAWRFEPCDQIGGDIFNFQYTGQNHISFYMFDVCGHGVSSALIASAVSQFIQTSCSTMLPETETPRPEAVLNNLEKTFPFERFESFFTIVYITIDYTKGHLYYSSAGHPPLILMGQNGSLRMLDVHGPVIGTGSGHSYLREKVQLKSGDKVILYTDGILDYSNSRGEFFGKERLLRILGQFAARPVQTLMDMVQESMKKFVGAASPNDDASIMAIEYME
jgi:PAS domain S-box-containing protein